MADTVRVTQIGAYVKTLIDSEEIRTTNVRAYVKVRPTVGDLRTTAVSAYVKVYKPWPPATPCKPHARYIYNGVEITDYCNAVDLQAMPRELAAKTLGSTGMPYKPGISDYSVGLKGDWNPVIDALLGADALRGTKRSSEVLFDDCDAEISYAWAEAFVANWKVTAAALGKLEWTATLRHNGAGVRTIS